MDRHLDLVEALRRAVLGSEGATPRSLREALSDDGDVPEDLRAYVGKVRDHAYRVTDEDVAALKAAGYTEDQLFEITVSAAVGAGLKRLHAGLAPLKGAR